MADEDIEELLRGYRLPEASTALDRRVLADAAAILEHEGPAVAWIDVLDAALQRIGFGFVAWLIDLVTDTDAEYRVAVL